MKLVYTVLVLAALVYAERRLIEPRLTGARLSALVQAALVYTVLVYQEWIPSVKVPFWSLGNFIHHNLPPSYAAVIEYQYCWEGNCALDKCLVQ